MKRCLSVLLCILLLMPLLAVVLRVAPAHAATMAELEQEVDRLDGEIEANKQKLAEYANKRESQEAYLQTVQEQIDAVQKKADTLNTKIEDSKESLSGKLRSNYITGSETTLKILMGADSLASFLTRLEMMRRISENEKKVINDFKEEVEQLRIARQSLEKKQSELEEKQAQVTETKALTVEKKAELTAKQQDYQDTIDELEADYQKSENYIKQLDKDSAAYQNYVKKLEQDRENADREIDELIRALTATSAPPTTVGPSGETISIANGDPSDLTTTTEPTTIPEGYIQTEIWAWPLANYPCYISSPFGYRDWRIGGNAFHGGTDIAGSGIYGQPIFASRSGYVAAAVWGTTGYGRYVVLDHCDGFVTIYGHCSNLTVTQGQYVVQGQQIANVGSTGNSTGPHLHFEVRYNGVKQNPMNFVTKP